MPSAGGIRAGKAFVELSLDDNQLTRGLRMAEKRLRMFAQSVRAVGDQLKRVGVGLAGLGGAAFAPLAAATKAFAGFEDAMASLRANANPTADQLLRVNQAAGQLSKDLGIGPAAAVKAMTELLKAGVPLESVLSEAGAAALKFARIAGMETAVAATTLSKAMAVFGVDATNAANALSRAADASAISVEELSLSFSQAAAVAGQAGLSIEETANAIAILGQNGIVGSDAGTSLRTMLNRLKSGVDSAGKAMQDLGIQVRDNAGNMKDFRGIVTELESRLKGLSPQLRDIALYDLFGSDAIRAGTIFLKEGVGGLDAFTAKAEQSLSVTDKFATIMDTLSGGLARVLASVERLAVAIGDALSSSFGDVFGRVASGIDSLSAFIRENGRLVVAVAAAAAGLAATGVAVVGLGVALSSAGVIFGTLAAAIGFLLSPIGVVVAALGTLAVATHTGVQFMGDSLAWLGERFGDLREAATVAFAGIADALAAGDVALAGQVLWASLKVQWTKGVNFLSAIWGGFTDYIKSAFAQASAAIASILVDLQAKFQQAMRLVNPFGPGFDQIEAERQSNQRGVRDNLAGRLNEIGGGSAAADVARDQALRAAEAELAALLNQAKGARGSATATTTGQPPDAPPGMPAMPALAEAQVEAIDEGLAAVERKTEVKGSFNAAALRGLGSDSIQDKQLEQQRLAAEALKKIQRNTDQIGLAT